MYNSWVKPVEGYTIRTAWMQGEQDRSSGLANYYQTDCLSLLTDGEKYGELVIFLSLFAN